MNRITIIKYAFTIILGVLLINTSIVFAQDNIAKIDIKTSAICNQCKTRIEGGILKQKGVIDATLNLDNKILTVNYNPDKTSPEKLRNSIAKLGYDADDVKADKKAYNKLPNCCKESPTSKEGGCNHKEGYQHKEGGCNHKK